LFVTKLSQALDLVVECTKQSLTLSEEAPRFRFKGQVPDGVKDDFEFFRAALLHEVETDKLLQRLHE